MSIPVTVFLTCVILVFFISRPSFGLALAKYIEIYRPLKLSEINIADNTSTIIVVLGGGIYAEPPEFRRGSVSSSTLERLRYAATINRQTGCKILVTGGISHIGTKSEAELMAQCLEEDFGIGGILLETRSVNTFDHGKYVPPILRDNNINRVILVTHSSHMRRALRVFSNSSTAFIPAPIGFSSPELRNNNSRFLHLNIDIIYLNIRLIYELLGNIYYLFRP